MGTMLAPWLQVVQSDLPPVIADHRDSLLVDLCALGELRGWSERPTSLKSAPMLPSLAPLANSLLLQSRGGLLPRGFPLGALTLQISRRAKLLLLSGLLLGCGMTPAQMDAPASPISDGSDLKLGQI